MSRARAIASWAMVRAVGAVVVVVVVAAGAAGGCIGSGQDNGYAVRTGGDADRGRDTITARQCGSCHTIPHVTGADGVVGPPLTAFGRRSFIAGQLPNTPRNLIRWIKSPHDVEPGTAMPVLGLDDREAKDVAAYLYTLR
jgi:cytochrome c2